MTMSFGSRILFISFANWLSAVSTLFAPVPSSSELVWRTVPSNATAEWRLPAALLKSNLRHEAFREPELMYVLRELV